MISEPEKYRVIAKNPEGATPHGFRALVRIHFVLPMSSLSLLSPRPHIEFAFSLSDPLPCQAAQLPLQDSEMADIHNQLLYELMRYSANFLLLEFTNAGIVSLSDVQRIGFWSFHARYASLLRAALGFSEGGHNWARHVHEWVPECTRIREAGHSRL
ncbi:hypothetical protein BDZ89DRAFT_1132655 [Hymenopellis radicata]|nr:hypothetical protein BDZ89DRAFT_1132655 [Hymenopellis radicata]